MNTSTATSTDPEFVCDECDFRTRDATLLEPVKDLPMRVSGGEPMPDGQCPNCGALVREEDPNCDHGEPTPTRIADLDAIDQALAVCDTLLSDSSAPDLRRKRFDLEAAEKAVARLRAYGNLTAHPLAELCRQAFTEIRTLADAHGPNIWEEGTATSKRWKIDEAARVALQALAAAPPVRILVDVCDGSVEVSCNYQAELVKLDYDCDGDISEDVRLLGTEGHKPDPFAKGCYIVDDILDPTPDDIDHDFARARSSTPKFPEGDEA